MQTIVARNIEDALQKGLDHLTQRGFHQASRNGAVVRTHMPVTTTYLRPTERVLFWPARDANPFFHHFEALWMLAGRNDIEPLAWYVARMREFSDDGVTQPAAYGHRWRKHFGRDQLATIAHALRQDSTCRRQVLSMWDGHHDLGRKSVDLPCNTHAYFEVVGGQLNMLVSCRSNDVIWGAYGANGVHFSVLLEYMARRIGVGVGVYHQLSFNYHAYTDLFNKLRAAQDDHSRHARHYNDHDLKPAPLFANLEDFHHDLDVFFRRDPDVVIASDFEENTLQDAHCMRRAYGLHKERNYARAIKAAEMINAPDWRRACVEWLVRRANRQQGKS